MRRKIKVLIVDDSPVFREAMARGISADPHIQVIAKAADPFEARDKILQYHPDVMICDVEMPKMNGIEFLRRLLPQYALPVLIVSQVSRAVFDALNAGAIDFVVKPDAGSRKSIDSFFVTLIEKIKMAAQANITKEQAAGTKVTTIRNSAIKLVAVGSSTGGTEAIYTLLMALPSSGFPGIVIAQHIPPVFSRMFAERLNMSTSFQVKEAQTGDIIAPSKVLIAPGDKHMKVVKEGSCYKIVCFTAEKVNGHRPSVDVLFESVAKTAGPEAIGVILTGMGYDGTKGLLAMKHRGARTIGQDAASSVVYGMPKAAVEAGAVEKQAALTSIPHTLSSIINKQS